MALPGSLPKIILFGDSLTELSFDDLTRGFGLHLQKKFAGKAAVSNRGFSGWTSEDLITEFDEILHHAQQPSHGPVLLLTIWLGANDACLPPDSAHVPLPRFSANLRSFIDGALRSPAFASAAVVLIAPPPIALWEPDLPARLASAAPDDADAQAELDGLRTACREKLGHRTYAAKRAYARRAVAIAHEYERATAGEGPAGRARVFGVDFWGAVTADELRERGWEVDAGAVDGMDEGQLPGSGLPCAGEFREGVFTDGLHLDEKGYAVLNGELDRLIAEKIPELRKLEVK